MSAEPVEEAVETFPAVLAEWVTVMHAAGLSPATVKSRVMSLRKLVGVTGADPLTVTTADLAALLARPGIAQGTRCMYYANMKAWVRYLHDTDRRTDDPLRAIRKPKAPRRAPRPLATDVVARLLEQPGRVRTFALLACYQGLRVHEVAKIRGQDVTEASLRVVGKGGVEAVLPTHPQVWAEAQKYPRRGYWFPGRHDPTQPIVPQTVTRAVMRALVRVDAQGTAHQLRHLYGTQVLRAAGGNIRVAQELLRHSSPAVTALYTLVEDSERRSAVLALPDYTTPAPEGQSVTSDDDEEEDPDV